jgi:hypothetical protein
MERGPADGEGFVAVWGEGVPRVGCDVHHAFVAERREWRFIPVENAVEFFVCRLGVILSRRAQHV